MLTNLRNSITSKLNGLRNVTLSFTRKLIQAIYAILATLGVLAMVYTGGLAITGVALSVVGYIRYTGGMGFYAYAFTTAMDYAFLTLCAIVIGLVIAESLSIAVWFPLWLAVVFMSFIAYRVTSILI